MITLLAAFGISYLVASVFVDALFFIAACEETMGV